MSTEHWQLEGNAADLYQRYLVPTITAKWARDLVGRAVLRPGEAVLDVACGTGVVARLATAGTSGRIVTGLDLNAAMLAVARSIPYQGSPITWIEGSALDLPFSLGSFDVVLCQLGLQFFPDQKQALQEMRRVLRSPGRIALSVYSAIERTPGAHAFVRALDAVLGTASSQTKRWEHSFTEPAQLQRLLYECGFDAVDVQTVEQTIIFPSVVDYVRFQLLATPMAALLKDNKVDDREVIIASVAAETRALSTSAMLDGGKFTFPQEAYVGTATTSR